MLSCPGSTVGELLGQTLEIRTAESIYSQWLAMRFLRSQVCSNCRHVREEDVMMAETSKRSGQRSRDVDE